ASFSLQKFGNDGITLPPWMELQASSCSNVTDTKHETVYGPSTPMWQTPRTMILSPETKSAYLDPSLSLEPHSTCQVDKESAQEVNCRGSRIASASDDLVHQQDIITTGLHKENSLSFSITKPLRGQKSLQFPCSALSNSGAEKLSLLNPYQVSSEPNKSGNCNTENTGGSVKSSRNASELENSSNLQKEMSHQIMPKNNLQLIETLGLQEFNPISVKEGPSYPWPPVIHTFNILKSKETVGNTDREQYSAPDSTNDFPAAINNIPMKGLKHIPTLTSSMETIACSQELASNNNLCLSLSHHPNDGKKRKLSPSQKQQTAGLASYSPQPDSNSKYCFKRHKVFADKVEAVCQNMKILESKDMQGSERFSTQELALELNENNTSNSSANFRHVYPRPIMYENCDLGQGKICTAMPNLTNMTNSVEVSTLHDNSETIRLGLSSPAYNAEQIASVEKESQRMASSESDWGKFLALSASSELTTQGVNLEKELLARFEHRLNRLQAFLNKCDESNEYYSHGLQHLSSADRSAIAVKLEKQAIKLSLEE
ncbi:hypothetical protein KI387_042713, partial [Taxus chinensis]